MNMITLVYSIIISVLH